ncbi:MAG: DUF2232 domain-containing protein [Gammaproteobacteria bacterium]|nr:DUF2232 domain-containing protein [Gammaproteobacteria bacterium]
MWGVARLAMRGPLVAPLVIAAFALLAMIFVPALIVSGGLLGLVTLRHGAFEGLRTLLIAGALTLGVLLLINGRLGAAAASVFAAWLPVWSASQTLRRTGQQGAALANIGICAAGYAGLMRLANPDVDAFWRGRLTALGSAVEAQGGKFLTTNEITLVGNLMHQVSIALLCTGLISMLLLGRWWQAGLYNPGGFRQEFYALAVPRWLSPLAVGAALASLILKTQGGGAGAAGDFVLVLVLVFSLQGLAILHASCAAKALTRGWLVGAYVMLGVVPQFVVPLLAVLGIADGTRKFRARLKVSEE